jgi:hypothetical protein
MVAKAQQKNNWKPVPLSKLGENQFPIVIYRKFKKELGKVNIHLCLIDAAIQDLALGYEQSQDNIAFLRERTRKHGHRRLGTDNLNLKFAMRLAYISQVAFLLSNLEQLCRELQKHSLINNQFKDSLKGDFLRRTLWIIAVSRKGVKLSSPIENDEAFHYVDSLDLAVYDYYRTMRNIALHSVSGSTTTDSIGNIDGSLDKIYSEIDLSRCKSDLGYVPTLNGEVTFNDVLVVSKMCQRTARSLCRSIVDPNRDILPELRRRLGNHKADRRRHAAKAVLSQTFLLDVADIEGILTDLAW